MTNLSKSYLFAYGYENDVGGLGVGSIEIQQGEFHPINMDVLIDACRIVREQLNLPESRKVIPFSFQRFEVL